MASTSERQTGLALPAVAIVTLNWNRAEDTIVCLQSLLALDYPNVQILVCDNASEFASVERIRSWMQQTGLVLHEFFPHAGPVVPASVHGICLIHTGANLGFAGGINAGIRHALAQHDFDFLWVLNNDTEVAVDALTQLVECVARDPSIGICGSTLLCHAQPDQVQAWGGASYVPWRARSIALGAFSHIDAIPEDGTVVQEKIAYVIGAAMFVSRLYLEKVGLMDESYFLFSEDHDWAERGRGQFRLAYASRSRVFHKHGATIGTSPSGGSMLSLYYLYRSKIMFVTRHNPWWLPTALVSLLWEAMKLMLKGHPLKAFAALNGMCSALVGKAKP